MLIGLVQHGQQAIAETLESGHPQLMGADDFLDDLPLQVGVRSRKCLLPERL